MLVSCPECKRKFHLNSHSKDGGLLPERDKALCTECFNRINNKIIDDDCKDLVMKSLSKEELILVISHLFEAYKLKEKNGEDAVGVLNKAGCFKIPNFSQEKMIYLAHIIDEDL